MTTTCVPCIWGPALPSLLSYPDSSSPAPLTVASASFVTTIDAVSADLTVITEQPGPPGTVGDTLGTPQVITVTATATTTATATITSIATTVNTIVTGPVVITTNAATITTITTYAGLWSTLGAELKSPTTYGLYTNFQGAFASGFHCADPRALTAFRITYLPSASLIFPVDNNLTLPTDLIPYVNNNITLTEYDFGQNISQCSVPTLPPLIPISSAFTNSSSLTSANAIISTASQNVLSSWSSATSSQSPGPNVVSNNLTAGASAGIGLGVALAVVSLALAAAFVWGRRRKRVRQSALALPSSSEKRSINAANHDDAAELDAKSVAIVELGPEEIVELGGEAPVELEADTQPTAELKGHHTEHEMPAQSDAISNVSDSA